MRVACVHRCVHGISSHKTTAITCVADTLSSQAHQDSTARRLRRTNPRAGSGSAPRGRRGDYQERSFTEATETIS